MITIRRALPVAVALTFVLASCGGSSDGDADDVELPATVEATAPEETEDFTPADSSAVESSEVEGSAVENSEVENTEADASEVESSEPDAAAVTVQETAPEEAAPDATNETEAAETVPADSDDSGAATTDPAEDPGADAAAGSALDVSLMEWEIDAPTEYSAGETTFNASNNGSFPHEFVVIEGEGYESLPLAEGGAVDEASLPTGALLGRTPRIGGGSSEALTVTLAPGSYVLVCNLGGGTNSHAGQGQRLDITVT